MVVRSGLGIRIDQLDRTARSQTLVSALRSLSQSLTRKISKRPLRRQRFTSFGRRSLSSKCLGLRPKATTSGCHMHTNLTITCFQELSQWEKTLLSATLVGKDLVSSGRQWYAPTELYEASSNRFTSIDMSEQRCFEGWESASLVRFWTPNIMVK